MELLTTVETINSSLYTITTVDPLTVQQVNIAPIRQIYPITLNSNVLVKTLLPSLGNFLAGGPSPAIFLEVPTGGLTISGNVSNALWIVRGLAFINVIDGFLYMFSANSPSVSFRQTYPDLFPVLTTDTINNGILNNKYYITVISSPTKNGNTWTWPLYDTIININGDTTSYDINIYPYVK